MIHRCVLLLALYTRYFPESCEKNITSMLLGWDSGCDIFSQDSGGKYWVYSAYTHRCMGRNQIFFIPDANLTSIKMHLGLIVHVSGCDVIISHDRTFTLSLVVRRSCWRNGYSWNAKEAKHLREFGAISSVLGIDQHYQCSQTNLLVIECR